MTRTATEQQPEPFHFNINTPATYTHWFVNSLPTISWDSTVMPKGSTLDIQLMNHEQKEGLYLSRYVPAGLGSTKVNLRPEIVPGTYSLILTVYRSRSNEVLGRSLVQPLRILVETERSEPEASSTTTTSSSSASSSTAVLATRKHSRQDSSSSSSLLAKKFVSRRDPNRFFFTKEFRTAELESEPVSLTYPNRATTMILMAPYTMKWVVPEPLKDDTEAKVNILVMSEDKKTLKTEVAGVLAANVNAKAGFEILFLPRDLSSKEWYFIQVEVFGRGRKFVGRTQAFKTRPSAFIRPIDA
ncbi:hypothetical protein BGZ83_007626 [Gryganskiella cystojenkinii]|nr:hypothetical protein BGZ83_007626 [Gryganskiella cystojenkinii]